MLGGRSFAVVAHGFQGYFSVSYFQILIKRFSALTPKFASACLLNMRQYSPIILLMSRPHITHSLILTYHTHCRNKFANRLICD